MIREQLDDWARKSQQIFPMRLRWLDRKNLIRHFGSWKLTRGAEIGVDRGRFSEYMLQNIPGLQLLCVDPWHWRLRGESRYKSAAERLEPLGATIFRETSVQASLRVPDGSLDFVYIDGDHTFDHVITDIVLWSRKVKLGGIVAGHDYYHTNRAGVIPAVNIYCQQHSITRLFLTGEEKTASWFFRRDPSFADPLPEQD